MLVLKRKECESIVLKYEDIEIVVTVLKNGRLGIEAPEEVAILRDELCETDDW